jgi:hypothetical protein
MRRTPCVTQRTALPQWGNDHEPSGNLLRFAMEAKCPFSMIYRSSKWWIYPRQMVKFTQSNHTSQRKDSCKFRKAQEIPRVVQWLSSPPSTQVVALMVVFQAQPSISELVMIRSVQFSSHHLFTIETAIDRGIQSDGICNMPRFTIICLPKKSPNLMLSARCPS